MTNTILSDPTLSRNHQNELCPLDRAVFDLAHSLREQCLIRPHANIVRQIGNAAWRFAHWQKDNIRDYLAFIERYYRITTHEYPPPSGFYFIACMLSTAEYADLVAGEFEL